LLQPRERISSGCVIAPETNSFSALGNSNRHLLTALHQLNPILDQDSG
jgi:hypothetical protein